MAYNGGYLCTAANQPQSNCQPCWCHSEITRDENAHDGGAGRYLSLAWVRLVDAGAYSRRGWVVFAEIGPNGSLLTDDEVAQGNIYSSQAGYPRNFQIAASSGVADPKRRVGHIVLDELLT